MRRLARVALALAALLLVAAFAELALRVVGVGQLMTYERDPAYGYRMRPSQIVSTYGDPIEINGIGLRGPEVVAARLPGTVRVLFLGDGLLYGGGRVHEGDLFVRRIEFMARNDGLRVEAVNVAAPGWSPQNWAIWIERYGALGADLAVTVLGASDRARPFATLESARLVERAPFSRLGALWLRVAVRFGDAGPRQEDPLAHNLEALRRLADALDPVPLLVVFAPSRDPDPTPALWAPFEALHPEAIDLRGELGPDDFLDPAHLSSAGHQRVAQALYPKLRPRFAELAVGAARGVR